MKTRLFFAAMIFFGASGCEDRTQSMLDEVAARCAIPISSIYLVKADNTFVVRENVNTGTWSVAGRACIRKWATEKRYTYFDIGLPKSSRPPIDL